MIYLQKTSNILKWWLVTSVGNVPKCLIDVNKKYSSVLKMELMWHHWWKALTQKLVTLFTVMTPKETHHIWNPHKSIFKKKRHSPLTNYTNSRFHTWRFCYFDFRLSICSYVAEKPCGCLYNMLQCIYFSSLNYISKSISFTIQKSWNKTSYDYFHLITKIKKRSLNVKFF